MDLFSGNVFLYAKLCLSKTPETGRGLGCLVSAVDFFVDCLGLFVGKQAGQLTKISTKNIQFQGNFLTQIHSGKILHWLANRHSADKTLNSDISCFVWQQPWQIASTCQIVKHLLAWISWFRQPRQRRSKLESLACWHEGMMARTNNLGLRPFVDWFLALFGPLSPKGRRAPDSFLTLLGFQAPSSPKWLCSLRRAVSILGTCTVADLRSFRGGFLPFGPSSWPQVKVDKQPWASKRTGLVCP